MVWGHGGQFASLRSSCSAPTGQHNHLLPLCTGLQCDTDLHEYAAGRLRDVEQLSTSISASLNYYCYEIEATMNCKSLTLAACLFAATLSAFAQGPGWTANSTVAKLVVTSDGGVNVSLSPAVNNCVSQSGYGPNFASVYPTHPGINRIKADLLVAYLTGKPVALYFNDSSCTVVEMILGGW